MSHRQAGIRNHKQEKLPKANTKPVKESQKSMPWKGLNRWHWMAIQALMFVAFGGIAYWLLAIKNADYLYAVQDHSLFVNDASFLNDFMLKIGGLTQWAGCWFTQFFYHPWAGSLLLIALWACIFALSNKITRLPAWASALSLIPCFSLLTSIDGIGYWLFYQKMQGYWFVPTLGILIALGFVCIIDLIRNQWIKAIASAIVVAVLYPIIGFWALFCGGISIVSALTDKQLSLTGKGVMSVLTILAGIASPLICYNIFARTRIEDIWTVNFPIFQNDIYISWGHSIPFVVAVISIFILCLFRIGIIKLKPKSEVWMVIIVTALTFGISTHICEERDFDDNNFHSELKIYQAVNDCRWNDVLDIAADAAVASDSTTRQIVISKNIALLNKGEIGNKMFHYDNSGKLPQSRDSLQVHLVQVCGPQIYFNYGKANFACRWAIENSVEFGFNVDNLKMLVRCAMISKEPELAKKYLSVLKKTMFHKQWAEERLAMVNDSTLYQQTEEYKAIQPMRCFKNTLDGDEGLCEIYLNSYFSNMHSKEEKFQEATLAFALIQKDIQLFWPRFMGYATLHKGQEMPIHYQEAAYLYGHLENNVDISNMPFDEERIVVRYEKFQRDTQQMMRNGMDSKQVGINTRAIYGDTFWWFYFFCRDIHSY